MKTIQLSISYQNRPASTATASFEDDEWLQLSKYYAHAKAFQTLSLIESGNLGSLKLDHRQGEELKFEVSLPQTEALAALLHKIRRFILNDEPTSYNRITGILKRRFTDSLIRDLIDTQRKCFDGRDLQSLFKVCVNGVVINSEEMLNKWLNSTGEYHENFDEKKELENFRDVVPHEVMQAIFLMVLTDKIRAIKSVAGFVGLILQEEKTFTGPVRSGH